MFTILPGVDRATAVYNMCLQTDIQCIEVTYDASGTWHDENSWKITWGGVVTTGDAPSEVFTIGSCPSPPADQ